ncbi:DUF6286 domain-containing protein [Streptomyces sp. NPDC047928]|uniref:DUF6286 domain-containing protein n=1 Tax=unclassified Streptomyces TaxID=2593676 RepID=UPI00371CBF64
MNDVREPPSAPVPVLEERRGHRGTGRFWSVRRVPAGLTALAVLVGAGLLLYDVAAVRADRPAMRWRRALAGDLATLPLDDARMLGAAAAACALGVWLLALAVTPGLRAVLPMRRRDESVRAGIDRDAVALVLRDRVQEVPGVRSVRVRVRRARAVVRAVSHFRELDDVHADVEAALAGAVEELGLARSPALSVRVVRTERKG